MKIVNGKIAEATRDEMYDYYLTREWYILYPFPEYIRLCKAGGTKIINEQE